MNIIEYNRQAWNRQAQAGSEWSVPVSAEVIQAARIGDWHVILTPTTAVPADWFGALPGKQVLCLASGGGQQAPVLAAAGAIVTSFDNSDAQLERDRQVAEREGLAIRCLRGDMSDLSAFSDESFNLIVHPISNLFVPDVRIVWRECFRVLKPGGDILAGFMNPDFFLFDHDEVEQTGQLIVRNKLPYSDTDSLSGEARRQWLASGRPAEFSHTLQDQIGGQISAGFAITGFYEDHWTDEATLFNRFSAVAIATRGTRPAQPRP
jgi:ubiquinone/menaquinone biosynthesis C-methylase UbiE